MFSMRVQLRVIAATVTLLAPLAAAGCARQHAGQAPHARRANKVGAGPITSDELRAVGDRDTYSAIQLLRPQFLHYRGQTDFRGISPTQPDVFVDGVFYGPLSSLTGIPAREVEEIRLLTVGDAVLKYGMGHTSGVIDITSMH